MKQFKSIMRAERRGHVMFETASKGGKTYITGVFRRCALKPRHQNEPMVGRCVRLNNGDVQRFIPYTL